MSREYTAVMVNNELSRIQEMQAELQIHQWGPLKFSGLVVTTKNTSGGNILTATKIQWFSGFSGDA